jgi:hypothetical protein
MVLTVFCHYFAFLITLMKNILRWITAGLTATFLALAAHAADMAPGTFAASTVKGDVSYKLAGATNYVKLAPGTTLPQGSTIKTAPGSLAIVVFASGSTATVRPASEVVINFDQKPFSGAIPVGAEPSVSNTKIHIVDGSVISKVAKLKKGSEFNITSPVGAAGVRGTDLEVSYSAATGAFNVTCASGAVVVQSADGTATPVSAGQTLSSTGGGVQAAPPAALAAMEAASESPDAPSATQVQAGEAPAPAAPAAGETTATGETTTGGTATTGETTTGGTATTGETTTGGTATTGETTTGGTATTGETASTGGTTATSNGSYSAAAAASVGGAAGVANIGSLGGGSTGSTGSTGGSSGGSTGGGIPSGPTIPDTTIVDPVSPN